MTPPIPTPKSSEELLYRKSMKGCHAAAPSKHPWSPRRFRFLRLTLTLNRLSAPWLTPPPLTPTTICTYGQLGCFILLLFWATGGYAQSPTSPDSDKAIPESEFQVQKLLKSLSGTWSITEYDPSKTPSIGVGHGREIWRPGPGGPSMIEEFHTTGRAGEVVGMAVLWWDGTEQGFRTRGV